MNKWQIPSGWEWKTLSEISEINPRRPRIQRDDGQPTSFVPMEDVDEIEGRFRQVQIKPYGDVKRGYTYFEEDDVLYAKITPSMENGKTAIGRELIDGFGFGTTEFHVLRPNRGILPEYLHYFVRRVPFRLEAKQHFRGAVGQQRVPKDFLISYPFPVPFPDEPERSLAEQRQIVARIEALLAEVREMRQLHGEITADANKLIDAVLTETFAPKELERWPNKMVLGDLAEITARQVDPTLPAYRDMPHIYGATIEEGTGKLLEYNTAAEDGMTSGKYHFKAGAVLYSKIRPYLRKATIADFDGLCSADMYPLRLKTDDILPEFLMWSLLSPVFTNYANSLSGRARIPKLNRTQLFSYEMPYPQRDLQKAICERLQYVREEIREMQTINNHDSELLDQLEQAILAQAFRGEL